MPKTKLTAKSKPTEKVSVKEEQKKITVSKEPEKLTTAKEPKKIAAAKEPAKITAAKEPKKIVEKKVEKLEVKETKTEGKTVKKAPAKRTTRKAAVKKTVASEKKAETVATKEVVKEVKKPAARKTTAKKTTTAKKAVAKKVVPAYAEWDLTTCIEKMQAMGVHYQYEDYTRILLDEADDKKLIKDMIEGNHIKEKNFTFEKDGFDEGLVPVTLTKVKETMDIKAEDFKVMKKDMSAALKAKVTEDNEANATEYLKEFKICEKILMVGQRKNITSSTEVSALLNADVDAFVAHFMAFAYDILPTWQYDDVKFYEDFIYAVLSQYADLYEKYQLNALIDVADLYIKHGDFQHGDVCYGYILRDNQIKDYIYYRFAHVYEAIDGNKAKALAYESLQYVDARFTYYENIMNIINQ